MSPSMKVFRWVLSHLTLITILLIITYFYWIWQDDEQPKPDAAITEQNRTTEQQDDKEKHTQKAPKALVQTDSKSVDLPVEVKKSVTEHVIIEKTEPVPDPRAFSERMRQYQLSLSKEEREQLASYNRALNSRNSKTAAEKKVEPEPVYPGEQVLLNKPLLPQSTAKTAASEAEFNSQEKEPLFPSAVPAEQIEKTVNIKEPARQHNLQEQIRSRQKQLSHQMVSLLAAKADVKSSDDMPALTGSEPERVLPSVKEVVPVIKTNEQKKLLAEARQAFEQGQYGTAEEKYLSLAAILPELPDVMGELANVYKTQNRNADYVAANTRFVKRLTNHYRFREAWRVVSETAEIDKNAADKQRRIINKKQKELETERFIQ